MFFSKIYAWGIEKLDMSLLLISFSLVHIMHLQLASDTLIMNDHHLYRWPEVKYLILFLFILIYLVAETQIINLLI